MPRGGGRSFPRKRLQFSLGLCTSRSCLPEISQSLPAHSFIPLAANTEESDTTAAPKEV